MQKYEIKLTKEELEKFILKKLKTYEMIFNKYILNSDISDKGYKTTLVRSLIYYFLYEEKNNGYKITHSLIAGVFSVDKSTVRKGIDKIRVYVENPKVLCSDKPLMNNLFLHFYFLFQKEFSKTQRV